MHKYLYLLVFLLCSPFLVLAQIKPAANDTLNYRLIGFTVPENTNAVTYRLQIATGAINNSVDFTKNIISDSAYTSGKMLAMVPEFGKTYTWRVLYQNKKGKVKEQSGFYHFTTGSADITDTSKNHLVVVQKATHHKNMLVLLDQSKAMYDMNGKLVWYLPEIQGIANSQISIRDLKPTKRGTLTFLTAGNIYEIDYDGNIIWKSNKDTSRKGIDTFDMYHHEFTRLNNGNYMVAGNEFVLVPLGIDSATAIERHVPVIQVKDGVAYRRLPLGTLEEYNAKGDRIWRWKSSDYIKDDSLFYKKIPKHPDDISPHMNSFYFDEKNNVIYISFKNAHHIVKISYPDGKILAYYYGLSETPPIFTGQHAVRLNNAGNMILFNNNRRGYKNSNAHDVSYITELKEENGKAVKIWEFPCNLDTLTPGTTGTGGNVLQLEDGCYISCVGTTGRIFMVTPGKQVVWNAIAQRYNTDLKEWQPSEEYRVSYINDPRQINELVFKTEIKEGLNMH